MAIFETMCTEQDYSLTDNAANFVRAYLTKRMEQKPDNFANARDVRNLLETMIAFQATRLISLGTPSKEELLLIEEEDARKAVMKNWKKSMLDI